MQDVLRSCTVGARTCDDYVVFGPVQFWSTAIVLAAIVIMIVLAGRAIRRRRQTASPRVGPIPFDPAFQPEPADSELIALLCSRDGIETTVELVSGERLAVWDIGWGYDYGDEFAHVLTNGSPGRDGLPLENFVTDEVRSVRDPQTGSVLWTARRG